MKKLFGATILGVVLMTTIAVGSVRAADEYAVDGAHSSVTFKISHLGLSWVHGRFDQVSGNFTIDADDVSKCAFDLAIKVESIDTNQKARDGHLRSPDFFNVKQFPEITFKSSSVKAIKDGYEVAGELTLHGVARPVTFALVGGRKAEFPKGVHRTGFSMELILKRSEFGMDKLAEAVGDDVHVAVSFEGTRK